MWDGELVHSPTLMYAEVQNQGQKLVVYRSTVVDTSGRLYAPVAAILAERCTEIVSVKEELDMSMMFGSAVRIERKIWARCPGADYPHRCRTAEDIDQEVRTLCTNQEEAAA